MFVVIAHHYCKPGQIDLARQSMDKSGLKLASEPGFLYRYRLERTTHPAILSALTAWTSENDYQQYRQKRFAAGHDLATTPYEKVESETFQVQSSHGKVPV